MPESRFDDAILTRLNRPVGDEPPIGRQPEGLDRIRRRVQDAELRPVLREHGRAENEQDQRGEQGLHSTLVIVIRRKQKCCRSASAGTNTPPSRESAAELYQANLAVAIRFNPRVP